MKKSNIPVKTFYAASQGTYGNALLNWANHAPSDIVEYAFSYRNAAHNLIACREKIEFGAIDHNACPIIFLFRHSIELYLKAIVYHLAKLSIDDGQLKIVLPKLWKEHSLVRLLEMAKPVMMAMRTSLPPALRELDQDTRLFLANLDGIDPGSYTFRYPVTSHGNSSLSDMLIVNIFVFADQADFALDELRSLCHYLIDKVHALSPQMRLDLTHLSRM